MSKLKRHWKLLAPLGALAIGITVFASAALAAPQAKEVRVAIMTDCKGAFAFAYEPDIGGAQAAFANSQEAMSRTRRSRPQA